MSTDLFYRVSVLAPAAAYDLSNDLGALTLEQREMQPDLLIVDLSDPYKVFSHALQEGMNVEVELGTAEDHSIVFRGRIYRVESDFPAQGVPKLKLQAFDHSMEMGLRKRNRAWTDQSLSDVVRAIAEKYFRKLVISLQGDPEYKGNGLRQQDETDLHFLLRLARQNGCVMFVKAGDMEDELHFVSEHEVMTAEPEVTLFYGRCDVKHSLTSFHSSADLSQIRLPRVFSGIDPETGQPVEAVTSEVREVGKTDDPFFDENLTAFRAKEPVKAAGLEQLLMAASDSRKEVRTALGEVERVATASFTTEKDLKLVASNQFSTSLRGMKGSGTSGGVKELMARTAVTLADLGGRFSGTWFLSQVRHVVNRDGYKTHFECRR